MPGEIELYYMGTAKRQRGRKEKVNCEGGFRPPAGREIETQSHKEQEDPQRGLWLPRFKLSATGKHAEDELFSARRSRREFSHRSPRSHPRISPSAPRSGVRSPGL